MEIIKYIESKTGKIVEAADVQAMNPNKLAYVGDAIYESFVRSYLLVNFKEPMHKIHARSVEIVRAGAQSKALQRILPLLTEDELFIVRRGRNKKSANIPGGADMIEYRRSTAFESLLGYLFLCGKTDRLFQIMLISSGFDGQPEKESDPVWEK